MAQNWQVLGEALRGSRDSESSRDLSASEQGPLVSVILPTWNRLSTLQRAVESVRTQTYRNWELWIIDDGSTDSTASWVLGELLPQLESQYEDRYRGVGDQGADHPSVGHWGSRQGCVYYVRTKNLGVSHARNLGIQLSRGAWVAFLDSDDEWLSHKLSRQMALAGSFQIIHGEEIWIRRGVRVNPWKKHQKSGGRIFKRSVDLCAMSPSTVLIHRDVLLSEGLFREDFPVCEDYDLWLRLTARWDVGFVKEPVIKKYGGHGDQLSQKYVAMDYWRVKSLAAMRGSSELSLEEREYLEKSLRKRAEILLKGYRKHNNMTHYEEIQHLL